VKIQMILPVATTVSLALLTAACQKPAPAVDAAGALPVAAKAADPGGEVSPAQPNGAINTGGNKTSENVVPASNSFTAGQAKGHIENAGYTDVGEPKMTADGLWVASAMKAGKPVNVTVDFKGAVAAN
jgi:hypothetical protein